MANIFRSLCVFTPVSGIETTETKYTLADTQAAALAAIEAAFVAESSVVGSIAPPEDVGAEYASGVGSGFVYVLEVTVVIAGDTHTTTLIRLVTGDTTQEAFDATQAQVIVDGDVLVGIVLAPTDPLTGDPVSPAGIRAVLFGAGGGFDIGFELIANQGCEKTGPLQCTLDGDDVLQWVDVSDVYTLNKIGNPQYKIPGADLTFPTTAPDKFQEMVQNRNANQIQLNVDICEAVTDQSKFTVGVRYWQQNSGPGTRDLVRLFTAALTISYVTGGGDQMQFAHAGPGGGTIILNGIPEDQMLTVLFRSDGVNVFAAVYDEDGLTLLDSGTAVNAFASAGNQMIMGAVEGRVKRVSVVNGNLIGDAQAAFLAALLTETPLVAA